MILIFSHPVLLKHLFSRAEQDEIVKKDSLKEFYETFKKQKNAEVTMETISKSNHLFEGKLEPLMSSMTKIY
jgi:alpha/beta superfamily hydrolase